MKSTSHPTSRPTTRPHYHARDDAALALARRCWRRRGDGGRRPPDVGTYYDAERGRHRLLRLPDRIGFVPNGATGADSAPIPLADTRIVDMRRELREGNRSVFSRSLAAALDATIAAGAASHPVSQPPGQRRLYAVPGLRLRHCLQPLLRRLRLSRRYGPPPLPLLQPDAPPAAGLSPVPAGQHPAPWAPRHGGGGGAQLAARYPDVAIERWDSDVVRGPGGVGARHVPPGRRRSAGSRPAPKWWRARPGLAQCNPVGRRAGRFGA